MFCSSCGAKIDDGIKFCPHCGTQNQKRVMEISPVKHSEQPDVIYPEGYIPKNKWTALFLCLFLGALGAHRFYVGRVISGTLMIVTLGGLGLWAVIDFIVICCNALTDRKKFALAK